MRSSGYPQDKSGYLRMSQTDQNMMLRKSQDILGISQDITKYLRLDEDILGWIRKFEGISGYLQDVSGYPSTDQDILRWIKIS